MDRTDALDLIRAFIEGQFKIETAFGAPTKAIMSRSYLVQLQEAVALLLAEYDDHQSALLGECQ